MEELFKMLVTGGAGIVALAFVFWMLFRELPEQRKSRETTAESNRAQIQTLVDNNQTHVEKLMTEFRAELAIERESSRAERTLDRQARHAMANALQTNNLVIAEISEHFPEMPRHSIAAKSVPKPEA